MADLALEGGSQQVHPVDQKLPGGRLAALGMQHVLVMYAGRAVEQADVFELFDSPRHPYTHGLMSSIPRLEDVPKSLLKTIKGQVPALHEMPAGCRFSNRCPHATDLCVGTNPVTEQLSDRHAVACHHWKELSI